MSPRSRRFLLLVLLIILALIALLFGRCKRAKIPTPTVATAAAPATTAQSIETPRAAPPLAPEVLTAATLTNPPEIPAGKPFEVKWTGPNNLGDYITIVPRDAADSAYANYTDTQKGSPLELLAPIAPGEFEIRYVSSRSKTVLTRSPIVVTAVAATLEAPEQAVLGTSVSVAWSGPNNPNDYITIVAKSVADGRYGNYTETAKGSPLTITVPVDAGEAELRYMTGQGARVLARRPIRILTPEVSLSAQDKVTAGTVFKTSWTGPDNPNDYVTIVPKDEPDGHYKNYTPTAKGSPLDLTALITPGPAELRYMTGIGARVLARRVIEVVPAAISLDAPAQVVAGASVAIRWTGPNNQGDYITIVPKTLPDGRYARYADTRKGSPLSVEAPLEPGDVEIRYVSGQGVVVLARRPLRTVAPQITLQAPASAPAASSVSIEWLGPSNPGDYLTVVPKSAKDGASLHTVLTARGSPAKLRVPDATGQVEIRYMSGQGNKVLARADLELVEKRP